MEKVLIPLMDNDVAPRFDLATEVLIVSINRDPSSTTTMGEKVLVIDIASPEAMCRLAISENIQTVICAGIEGEYHDFLQWKGATILDDICGPVDAILDAYIKGNLTQGECYY